MESVFTEVDLAHEKTDLRTAERQIAFTVASVRAVGGHLLKIRHETAQGAGIRHYLRARRQEGMIVFYIPGEELGTADPISVYLGEKYPAVTDDADWGAGNPGVTVVCI